MRLTFNSGCISMKKRSDTYTKLLTHTYHTYTPQTAHTTAQTPRTLPACTKTDDLFRGFCVQCMFNYK